MSRLLHDRYYCYAPEQAWDLATGDSVAVSQIPDLVPRSDPGDGPINEVLDHGRDGEPRWIVVETRAGQSSRALARRAADQARARGLVPVAADVYLRLRDLLVEELRHRTLLLIAGPGVTPESGRRALLDAAERSPRPHVLMSFRSSPFTPAQSSGFVVKEARSAYAPSRPIEFPAPGMTKDSTARVPEDVERQLARAARWAELCHAGRHAAAERLLRESAAALCRRRAFEPAARTLIMLGRLLLERGRAAQADAVFGEAVAHALTANREDVAASAGVWQASARTDAGQLTAAESLCRAALIVGALSGSDRARAEAALARVLLWQNRVEEAAACDLRVDPDVADGEWAAVGGVEVRVLVARGQLFAAGQRARDLLTRAEGSGQAIARVIALVAHTRVLLETGDLSLAEEALAQVHRAARVARTPLRALRARLLWIDALRRAGRSREAEQELRILQRLQRVTPPLLAAAIDGRLRPEQKAAASPVSQGAAGLATTMVAIARDEERDRDAVRQVLTFAAASLRTSRLDVCSADAGPDSIIVSVGSGLATVSGSRVLDAGIAIDARTETGGELGVPVRIGPRLIAALVARWPIHRPAPGQARELLELAAAVAAPRIDALHAASRDATATATAIPELIGSSDAMAEVRRAVARAAAAPFSVLIEGESGSGKELVARALHQLSPRRDRRFSDLNCAALPEELIESELFGHTRGAFTGAVADRPGLVEEADGGTLFLDEVADLSPRAQAKLLRVLQQQEVRRVGATSARKVDVRVISAANRDMRLEVSAGRFRQDLLYRLDVIRIRVPPLRERPADVPLLARHFWNAAAARVGSRATLSHGVLAALSRYDWPGNVRELQNVIAGLAVAGPATGQVRPGLLPPVIAGALPLSTTRLAEARDQFERRFLEAALARAAGRRTQAARELGLSRQGLLKMMTRLGFPPS